MREVQLTQNMVALVDDEDYDLVSKFSWYAQEFPNVWYAYTTIGGKKISMHQMLAGRGTKVDHRNGFGLDNRRFNLRPATTTQNAQNRRKLGRGLSKYKGVSKLKRLAGWVVRPRLNGKRVFVGYFKSETKAAQAYDNFARQNYQEFACLNFPREGERSAL